MNSASLSAGSKQQNRYFVLALCLLLCLFAVGAKTAVYRSHPAEVSGLTATKVWQSDAPADPAEGLRIAIVPFLLALVMLSLPLATRIRATRQPQPALQRARKSFSPHIAVRPPPFR